MHGDVPPHGAGSAIAAAHLNVMGHAVGWPSPRGRRRRLAGRARRPPPRAGRRVRTRAPVDRDPRRAGPGDGRRPSRAPSWSPRRLVVADVTPRACSPSRATRSTAATRARAAALPLRPRDAQGRLGAGRARSRGRRRRRARRAPSTSAGRGRAARRAGLAGGCRAPVHAPRPAVARRPHARAAGEHTAWAYTHGPHDADWEASATRTSSAWRRGSRRSRPASATASSPATCSRPPTWRPATPNLVHGDVGGGSYTLGQLVFRPVPRLSPVPDAGARAVPRQRRHVPRRGRARRPGSRRRTRGARRPPPAPRLLTEAPVRTRADGAGGWLRPPPPSAAREEGGMATTQHPREGGATGAEMANVSTALVQLYRRFYGRGAGRAPRRSTTATC